MTFQSTPLMRGATRPSPTDLAFWEFQSTPLMRGATPSNWTKSPLYSISIHAPHARGDEAGGNPPPL